LFCQNTQLDNSIQNIGLPQHCAAGSVSIHLLFYAKLGLVNLTPGLIGNRLLGRFHLFINHDKRLVVIM